ncbi:MAG: hypothetical protein K6356_02355 [Chloroflexus sp.]
MIVRRLRVLLLIICFALICLSMQGASLPVAMAQPAVTFELFTPFDGQYVVNAWLPLRVTLRNQASVAVTVTIAANPADEPVQYERTVRLAAGAQQQLWLYTFISRPVRSIVITLIADAVVVARQEFPLLLRPLEQMRVALGGAPAGGDVFAATNLRGADLPDHLLGLSSLSVLVLLDLDAPFSSAQQTALLAWVYSGGHLIIGGGPAAIAVQTVLPPSLRAATITGATVLDRQPLVARGGADLSQPLLGLQLQPVVGALPAGSTTTPPWIEFPVGRGRVTQLAFDPTALAVWPGRESFWQKLTQPVALAFRSDGTRVPFASYQADMLTPILDALPQIAIPAFTQSLTALTWYALALIALIGGFWRWRRFVPVAVLVSGAVISSVVGLWWTTTNATPAYSVLRLTLIEALDDQQAQMQTAMVLLSAMPRTETVTFSNPVIVRPLTVTTDGGREIVGPSGAWSQLTTQVTIALAPWQIQGLLATAVGPVPPVRATMIVDQGWLRVDVQNDSQVNARDVFVVYGDQLFSFGTLRPGARSVGRWPLNPTPTLTGTSLGQLVVNDLRVNGWLIDRPGDPTARIRSTLIDAAIATLPQRYDPGPYMIAWLDPDPATTRLATIERVETLLVTRPPIRGQGELNLPMGWLRLDLTDSALVSCLNGQGVQASGDVVEMRLRLPAALSALQARTMQVRLTLSEQSNTDSLTIRAHNWTTDEWDLIPVSNLSNITIPNAEPYLHAGTLRLQLRGELDQLGCVVVIGSVQGVLP